MALLTDFQVQVVECIVTGLTPPSEELITYSIGTGLPLNFELTQPTQSPACDYDMLYSYSIESVEWLTVSSDNKYFTISTTDQTHAGNF